MQGGHSLGEGQRGKEEERGDDGERAEDGERHGGASERGCSLPDMRGEFGEQLREIDVLKYPLRGTCSSAEGGPSQLLSDLCLERTKKFLKPLL